MNLSQLVNHANDAASPHPPAYRSSQQPTRPHSTLAANPYGAELPMVLVQSSTQKLPPSPPVEDGHQCSLPSISNLLRVAESGPAPDASLRPQMPHAQPPFAPRAFEMPYAGDHATAGTSRQILPPTPPPGPGSAYDRVPSPTASSTTSYFGSAINNLDPAAQRVHVPSIQRDDRRSIHSHASTSPYAGSSPGQDSNASSYYSPGHSPSSAVQLQRPLPGTNFQSPNVPMLTPSSTSPGAVSNGSNPWQHHHYISPSSQSTFAQSQDRYICQTCNKAFSRPSSLRIHSHSHTGEKPFKCPHHGCGKSFSVRSNMKRHERGCHSGTNPGSI